MGFNDTKNGVCGFKERKLVKPTKYRSLTICCDPVLLNVVHAVLCGCQHELPSTSEYGPYVWRTAELSLGLCCVVWGMRVVIPASLHKRSFNELHEGHLGVVKMKSLARSLLWWPGLDVDIERTVKACAMCQTDTDNPSSVSLLRLPTNSLWQRIHVDFAEPVMGRMFLLVIDAYSKWPEVAIMQSISVENTVKGLRSIFLQIKVFRRF